MPRYPVSPKGVLFIVLLDLFKVAKWLISIVTRSKSEKWLIFNYDSFKVAKWLILIMTCSKSAKWLILIMTRSKSAKCVFFKLGFLFSVNVYVYILMMLFYG